MASTASWAWSRPIAGTPDFDPWVPVMLYFDLEYMSEAELFDTINTTARKLPKALIEVTKGDITETGSARGRSRSGPSTFALARDEDSVWFGRVNMTGARDADRKVTYEGLRRSTANMLPAELMQRLWRSDMSPEDVAKRYWELVADACKPAWDEAVPAEFEDLEDEVDPETGEKVKADKFPGYRLGSWSAWPRSLGSAVTSSRPRWRTRTSTAAWASWSRSSAKSTG